MAARKPPLSVAELKALPWGEYIKTNHWKKFSKSLLDPEDVVCDICGISRWDGIYTRGKKKGKRKRLRQFQCHHKHYNNLGHESRDDVIVTCAQCHETIHNIEKLSSHRGGIWATIYELVLKLTNWQYEAFKSKEK